jgi:hypothetical protein
MMQRGYAMASEFKTKSKFKLQPVSLNKILKMLLRIYVEIFRPMRSKGRMDGKKDALFIRFDGGKEENMGRNITRFFKKTVCYAFWY